MTQSTPSPLNTEPIREWIDELPTRPSAFKATVVSVATVMLALLGLGFGYFGPPALEAYLEHNAAATIQLQDANLTTPINMLFTVFVVIGAYCGVAGLLGLYRKSLTYQVLRAVLMVVLPVVIGYTALAWWSVDVLVGSEVELDGAQLDRASGILLWWSFAWPALAVGVYTVWLLVMLKSRSVYAAFTGQVGPAMPGDRVLEDLRTHGRDPRARKSLYLSVITHIVVIILIPALLRMGGCVEAYRVPKGSGNPVVALVKLVKPKKKKKQTLTLRPNSAIIFDIPDLDDTQVDRMMEQMTQATYQVSNAQAGRTGKGGGTKGGWPEGMENYKIRFIRLNHGGVGWDDGMNQTNADVNFLQAFAQATGFTKIANKGESHSIALLAKYPSDGFPPFVYMTGNGGIGRVTESDRKILREYCLKGGMLIGDAGSEDFDRSFRSLMRQVFPDKPLLDIADDDVLYQLPFSFPNGAPAFWHHGGRRAMGIKHDGRWIVFYHPGDMNDAWKSPGYSDVTPEMRQAALDLGINLVCYAFNQWNDAVAQKRK
ncbi:MAG: DUF4159 domain-containing protein [Phycisphaera sp.]|nr:DUF4159 domain-containing protein [Phycisphaera sp.]